MGLRDFLFKSLAFALGARVNEFSTDGTLSGDSDEAVPTEKAVKTYADALSGSIVTVSGTFDAGDLDGSMNKTVTRGTPGDQYPSSVRIYNGSDKNVEVPVTPTSTTVTILHLTGEAAAEGGTIKGTWKYRLVFNS